MSVLKFTSPASPKTFRFTMDKDNFQDLSPAQQAAAERRKADDERYADDRQIDLAAARAAEQLRAAEASLRAAKEAFKVAEDQRNAAIERRAQEHKAAARQFQEEKKAAEAHRAKLLRCSHMNASALKEESKRK